MSAAEKAYDRINDFDAVKIGLASPSQIRSWSFGEVKSAAVIDYSTLRPVEDGLFCERIFGPEKDWECACGKYRDADDAGLVCDQCGVTVAHSRVRHKRVGHIELAAPVVHIWFFKVKPSRLGLLLDMRASNLERIIYMEDYVVIDPGDTPLKERQLLTEDEYRKAKDLDGRNERDRKLFEADIGAEAIRKLLVRIDLVSLATQLRRKLAATSSEYRIEYLSKRLSVVEALRDSGNRPEWMVLECIPVIAPGLRPLALSDSGVYKISDLNFHYRRILDCNKELKRQIASNAPEKTIRNLRRWLQQTVDTLFDNTRGNRPVIGVTNRPMRSLADMLNGKQDELRKGLPSKRVDYSACSAIVVDPDLKLHQCGLPKKIALELFQPFIIRRLNELAHAKPIVSTKEKLDRRDEPVWDILEEVMRNHPVLLNRAPTLNRMFIQAFEPVLVEGNAIHIHPLLCKGFDVGFDGDQVAVHLPLSTEAQVEATTLMMATMNIIDPANGNMIINPTQDIVMGAHYLTISRPSEPGEGMIFSSPKEVFLAQGQKKVGVHARIILRLPASRRLRGEGENVFMPGMMIKTTVGRIVFDDILDSRLPFYNVTLGREQLERIIADCHQVLGRRETILLLDRMKHLALRSFIAAASSRETTKVLINAALSGKVDDLTGLEENVILGRLVPAGTGFRAYVEAEIRFRS